MPSPSLKDHQKVIQAVAHVHNKVKILVSFHGNDLNFVNAELMPGNNKRENELWIRRVYQQFKEKRREIETRRYDPRVMILFYQQTIVSLKRIILDHSQGLQDPSNAVGIILFIKETVYLGFLLSICGTNFFSFQRKREKKLYLFHRVREISGCSLGLNSHSNYCKLVSRIL